VDLNHDLLAKYAFSVAINSTHAGALIISLTIFFLTKKNKQIEVRDLRFEEGRRRISKKSKSNS